MNVRRATITTAIVIGAAFGIAGCSSAPSLLPTETPDASELTVAGTITLHQDIGGSATVGHGGAFFDLQGSCGGNGGYSDLRSGMAVTIYNAAGTIVGTGTTGVGNIVPPASHESCRWSFTVPHVPAGSAFYQYEISHRGRLTFTADEASNLAAELNN